MDAMRKKLAQLRVACQKAVPYMAHQVYGLVAVERPGIGTMAVDKYGRLYYDPKFVGEITEECGVFALLHETLHVVLDHCGLAAKHLGPQPTARQLEAWNIAADIVINGILNHWMPHAPDGVMTAERFGFPPKLSAIQYYDLLMQEQEQGEPDSSSGEEEDDDTSSKESDDGEEEDGDSDGGRDRGSEPEAQGDRGGSEPDDAEGSEGGAADVRGGAGERAPDPGQDREGDGDGEDRGDRHGEAGESGEGDGDHDGGDEEGGDDAPGGSCADGQPRSYELPPDPAYADREYAAAQELEEAIAEQEAKAPGSVPGELKSAVEVRLRPQPDPFDSLRGAVARAVATPLGAPDYTLRRMSRRQGDPTGPRLRGIKKETPNCVVLLDTSGSMQLHGQSELKLRALAVIAKAVARLRSVKVICGDTDLHSRQVVNAVGRMKIEGGGGTDMGRLVEQIDKEDRPDAIIVVTDCETGWCPSKPRARVVVAAVKNSTGRYPVPSWARLVDLTKGGE
jgi:predicted metal-dependent peptidase